LPADVICCCHVVETPSPQQRLRTLRNVAGALSFLHRCARGPRVGLNSLSAATVGLFRGKEARLLDFGSATVFPVCVCVCVRGLRVGCVLYVSDVSCCCLHAPVCVPIASHPLFRLGSGFGFRRRAPLHAPPSTSSFQRSRRRSLLLETLPHQSCCSAKEKACCRTYGHILIAIGCTCLVWGGHHRCPRLG
jgi:hypothetical protein